jgi:hypothetical protein
MKPFLTVARHTIQILLIMLTLGTALFLVWHALTFVLPVELVIKMEAGARRGMGLSEHSLLPNDQYLVNSADAMGDHVAVMQWFSRCVRPPAGYDLPSEVINLVTFFPIPGRATGQNAPVFKVESTYLRTLTLSHDLINARARVNAKLAAAERMARTGAYASILIGFLTTVCIGLSAMPAIQDTNKLGIRLKAAALILPAFGTAVAAVIAFDDPAGHAARYASVAAGLQRFHGDIIKTTWNWNCAASLPNANHVLDEWTQRMQGLVNEANDGRGPQGNANGGSGAGGPQGNANGGSGAGGPAPH